MRHALLVIALLTLVVAGCGGTPPPDTGGYAAPEAIKAPRAHGTDPAAVVESPTAAEDSDRDTPLATDEEPAEPTVVLTTGPTETADPTIQALAASFKFPTLGDPNAPLTIYEFSDYL